MSKEHIIERLTEQVNELREENERLKRKVIDAEIECAHTAAELDDQIRERYRLIKRKGLTGCEHCLIEYDREGWRDGTPHELRIEGKHIFSFSASDGWEGTEIRFCPWCGRVLEDV